MRRGFLHLAILLAAISSANLALAQPAAKPAENGKSADTASAPAQTREQAEKTYQQRTQDAQGETERATEQNRVRSGEVGSEQAQQMQIRNEERKMLKDEQKAAKKQMQGQGSMSGKKPAGGQPRQSSGGKGPK